MWPKNIPPYMQKYYSEKISIHTSKPEEKELTKKEIKDQKFNEAIEKVKTAEDQKKKPLTEKEMSIDDYIELLVSENGSRKDYLNLLNSLV